MSVQFGRWSFDGEPPEPGYLEKAAGMLAPYGPDGGGAYSAPGIDILYRAFHTTKESRREQQPLATPSGSVITWDGRLDNREGLVEALGGALSAESTDLEIVAAAHDKWETDCFARLIGDWAVSIWNPQDRSLLLAKDFLGVRLLYYTIDNQRVTWSTVLTPLVLLPGKTVRLQEDYIAGWISSFPQAHLTPYAGIHAVPPASFVRLRPGQETSRRFWDFEPHRQIRYSSDQGYEQHFRWLFEQSVRRRLRSHSPVLAELSGGMDSSSIVSVADQVLARGEAETPRIDTLSFYDDCEPNWNERPFIASVEAARGRKGIHLDLTSAKIFTAGVRASGFPDLPGSVSGEDLRFSECLLAQGDRTVLSGIGGDEMTGGVPSPVPELTDLLARARLATLANKLKLWALEKRVPWFHLLFEAIKDFLPASLALPPARECDVPWLTRPLAAHSRGTILRLRRRSKFLGPLPSFQQSVKSFNLLRDQLACCGVPSNPPYEKCYPYLDRDFVEFAIAVPREQMVRPGQRRSLMRRALAGIVPAEILNRKRKAFVQQGPLRAISHEWQELTVLTSGMRSDSLGFVDSARFLQALKAASAGKMIPLVPLLRTTALERWLRALEERNCIAPCSQQADRKRFPVSEKEEPAMAQVL